MEFKQLQIFVQVCKTLNFSQTAQIMNYAQSTISEHIINLEKSLKTKLFERMHKKLFLTEDGKKLLIYANKLIDLKEAAIKDIQNGIKVIRVGIMESLCTYKFPTFFRQFLNEHTNIQIKFVIVRCEEIPLMLRKQEIDIGFTLDKHHNYSDIISELLFEEKIIFVVGKSLPRYEYVMNGDFNKTNVIISEGLTGYNIIFRDIYKKYNIEAGSMMYMESVEGIKSYVKGGFGITFIPKVAVEKELNDEVLIEVSPNGESYYHEVSMEIHKDYKMTSEVNALMLCAMSVFKSS